MPDLDDLMAAVVSGNLPEVWSLLDAPGAAPAIFEGREAMALSMACMHAGPYNIEREGIVNALLRAGATPDLVSLLHSINAGNVSVLKLLLDAGGDALAVGESGSTALQRACRSSAACVELLLDRKIKSVKRYRTMPSGAVRGVDGGDVLLRRLLYLPSYLFRVL